MNLFQQVEQGFDKLFNYNRQQVELFDYHNTMKNGCISELFKLQQQQIQSGERETEINQVSNQENLFSVNLENKKISNISFNTDRKLIEIMIRIFLKYNLVDKKVIFLLAPLPPLFYQV